MDTGLYASFPKRTRYSRGRNYRFGKYLRNKGYNRRTTFNTITNRSYGAYGKTRLGKYIKTNMQSVKCTYIDSITIPASGSHYQWDSGNVDYNTLANMLGGSLEFATRAIQYSYYKINGISVSATRRWIDPIALGVDGTTEGFLSLSGGLGMVHLNLYPNLTATSVGLPTMLADSSFKFSPFIHGVQSHYIPMPKNFTTGGNSNGLGVWNATSQIASLTGQVSLYDNNGSTPIVSDESEMDIFDIEVNFYVSFCNSTGSGGI